MGKQIKLADQEEQSEIVLERYNRQMLLKDWDQDKLLKATVFIAGVGALGTNIALNLAMMGIGHLILCDFDTIELSNLARQVLFEEKDIGKSKVLTAKNALERINPTIKITALDKQLETVDRKIFEECDVVADGLDTFEARRWLNSMCVTLNKPLVHGGMFGWMGNVQVVIPFKSPCLECHPLIPQNRLQKPCTPPGEARKELEEKEKPQEKIPTLATVSTVIAGIQSHEIIKIILGSEKILDGFLFYDSHSESLTKVELILNKNCIICGKYRIEGIDFALDSKDTIRDIKNRLIMSWGLQEPIRVIIKGIIQKDEIKIGDADLKEKEAFFVYDSLLSKPLKLFSIFEGKQFKDISPLPALKKEIIKVPSWSKIQEIIVDKGEVTYQKNLLKVQMWDSGQNIQFLKTQIISKYKRKIRYKVKHKNSK